MKNKDYPIKVTRQLIRELKPFWAKFKKIEDKYYGEINDLENYIEYKLKINGLEVFFCDNEACGIGNVSRTIRLIHREELEK